jgi:hypothetical protein
MDDRLTDEVAIFLMGVAVGLFIVVGMFALFGII